MQLQTLFDKYIKLCPEELSELKLLSEQLKQSDDITSRKNFVGHVTASAFIVNQHTKQVLLLEHKSLAKLLQPGGHVDPEDESLIAATKREIQEETGLQPEALTLRSFVPRDEAVPFDIDTHFIPENPKKNEPGHYHHDFRYIYTTSSSRVEIDPTESNGYKWVEWDNFSQVPSFTHIAEKIDAVLETGPRDFFRSLVNEKTHDVAVIAVSHIIPSSEDYLKSLNDSFNLVGIIPKPKSINQHTLESLKQDGIVILDKFSRQEIIDNPDKLIELLEPYERVCLIDIGGYFSEVMPHLKAELGAKLLGVVEDTENGHQKYEKSFSGKYNVISVARSPLKDFEDHLVGHSVAHATETVLREINKVITYRECGIIGYGKVGKGIADYLLQRGIKPRVSELSAIRAVEASCDGALICSTQELIKKSDIIFCATGTKALDLLKFRDVKKDAFIASVTSSDDEFDLKFVDSEYKSSKITDHIVRYSKRGHAFHLLNDGNAINFLYSAAVDQYINLVQGELIFSVIKLAENDTKKSQTVIVNGSDDHEAIARAWLELVLQNNAVAK